MMQACNIPLSAIHPLFRSGEPVAAYGTPIIRQIDLLPKHSTSLA